MSSSSSKTYLHADNGMRDDLDAMDYRILRALLDDGRCSDIKLGEMVNLSGTATARRRKILEEKGIITGYSTNLDLMRLGYGITVLVAIELSSQAESSLNEFETAARRSPSMSFCSFVSGETDFIMMMHVRSFEDFDRVYRKELSKLPHVARIRSNFLMHEVAKRNIAPIAVSSMPFDF